MCVLPPRSKECQGFCCPLYSNFLADLASSRLKKSLCFRESISFCLVSSGLCRYILLPKSSNPSKGTMNQRQLHKTIESFDSKKFESSEELLKHVLHQIIQNDRIEIQGGRVWKLNTTKYAYELIGQVGAMEKIKPHFLVKVNEYRMFKTLPKHRTIVAKETNAYLRSKGIFKYSATGVGELVKGRGGELYRYVMSFNTDLTHDQIAPT